MLRRIIADSESKHSHTHTETHWHKQTYVYVYTHLYEFSPAHTPTHHVHTYTHSLLRAYIANYQTLAYCGRRKINMHTRMYMSFFFINGKSWTWGCASICHYIRNIYFFTLYMQYTAVCVSRICMYVCVSVFLSVRLCETTILKLLWVRSCVKHLSWIESDIARSRLIQRELVCLEKKSIVRISWLKQTKIQKMKSMWRTVGKKEEKKAITKVVKRSSDKWMRGFVVGNKEEILIRCKVMGRAF